MGIVEALARTKRKDERLGKNTRRLETPLCSLERCASLDCAALNRFLSELVVLTVSVLGDVVWRPPTLARGKSR